MPHIDPFTGLFAALAGALAVILIPVFLLLRADIAGVRGEAAGNAERPTRIENGLEAIRTSQAGLEDGQTAARGELSATNELPACVEGTVAGALGRGFPEYMAQAPDLEVGADGGRPAIPIPEDRSAPRKSGSGSRSVRNANRGLPPRAS